MNYNPKIGMIGTNGSGRLTKFMLLRSPLQKLYNRDYSQCISNLQNDLWPPVNYGLTKSCFVNIHTRGDTDRSEPLSFLRCNIYCFRDSFIRYSSICKQLNVVTWWSMNSVYFLFIKTKVIKIYILDRTDKIFFLFLLNNDFNFQEKFIGYFYKKDFQEISILIWFAV